jgi:beta-glucosidase
MHFFLNLVARETYVTNMNKKPLHLVLFLLLLAASCKQAGSSFPVSDSPYKHQVDSVMALMTLEEKIGQMTLYTTDWGSTGPTIREGYENDIRKGNCGALFNAHTVAFTRHLQEIAVRESRLGIPL